jgi:hypothetical protein
MLVVSDNTLCSSWNSTHNPCALIMALAGLWMRGRLEIYQLHFKPLIMIAN